MFSGLKPIVYTGNMHQEVAGSIRAKFVFISFLWSFYRFSLKTCLREKADLIWANWWIPPGLIAARISKKLHIPLVISSHGTDISLLGKSGIISRLSRYVYAQADRATVVSSFLKDKLLDNLEAIADKNVAVIPMPVGMENFPKTSPPENDVPVLLSVARYTRQKRLNDILSAAEKIKADGFSFRILMVGEGPMETELKTLADQKGLSNCIEFIPLVSQQRLGELYRQSDVVMLSSEGEGFGLVLIEAGLTGRAVIGARSGGITDIIKDGENGLLYEVGDIDALADAIKTVLKDDDTRIKLGEGGHQRALDKFSTPVLVDRIYDLFISQMNNQRGSSSA